MFEITPIQKKILALFSKSILKNNFYWTGGTLLSFLYLHHRKSKDLDFFSDKPFRYEGVIRFVESLKKSLRITEIEQKKIFDRWEFFIYNKDKSRLEFVLYEHPKIKPRKKWQGITIDSLEDIATNKVMALFDRNDPKDLVDLYFLLVKKKYKIKQLLKWVNKKFGVELGESLFWSECCKELENLDDISPLLITKTEEQKKEVIEEIKEYFTSHSVNYLQKVLE